MHAHPRWPKACLPANIYSSISAGLAGVSLMHMYRGRVWLVLWPCQHATISIRTCKFHAGRRTSTSRRERISREFRGRTLCPWSRALDRSRGFANVLWATARKSGAKNASRIEIRIMARRKRPERALTSAILVILWQYQSNQVRYIL